MAHRATVGWLIRGGAALKRSQDGTRRATTIQVCGTSCSGQVEGELWHEGCTTSGDAAIRESKELVAGAVERTEVGSFAEDFVKDHHEVSECEI